MFNPDQFLEQTVDQAMDTVLIPVPVTEEGYLAVIEKVDARAWQGKADPSKSGVTLEVLWEIHDENVKKEVGREKVTIKQGIMLDLTDSGNLDLGKGKNVGLGRLREATGLNVAGQPFAFSMLPGKMSKVTVKHREHEGQIYAEVKGVLKV